MKRILHAMALGIVLLGAIGASAQSGCTYVYAENYDPAAVTDDGSCEILVCPGYEGEPTVNFAKADYANFLEQANWDIITPEVAITRQNDQGLYNPIQEFDFDQGPAGTFWKWGDAASTNPWRQWRDALQEEGGGGPSNQTLPFTMTMVIPDGDLLFEFEFTDWTSSGEGGGFAYTRTLVETPVCSEQPVTGGCTDITDCNYDPTAYYDDGSCSGIPGGCTDNTACNYDSFFKCDNGTCQYTVDCNGVCGGTATINDCGTCVAEGETDSSCFGGCTQPEACNYNAFAGFDDGSCNFPDGLEFLQCPNDITVAAADGMGSAPVSYTLPFVNGSCSGIFDVQLVSTVLSNNSETFRGILEDSYNWDYDGNNDISDGGGDMYDGGNELNTDLQTLIPYTNGTVEVGSAFGAGSQYVTLQNPGFFALVADLNGVDYFQTTGNNGADGGGVIQVNEFEFNGWTVYYKEICSAGDPNIIHFMLVPAGAGTNRTYSPDTNEDVDRINNLSGADKMIYILVSSTSGCQDDNAEAFAQTVCSALHNGNVNEDESLTLVEGLNSGEDFPLGTTTVTWSYENAATGDMYTCSFDVLVTGDLEGCTLVNAYNYNPAATINDGSCVTLDPGCAYQGDQMVSFSKANNADITLPENRDIISPTVEITRANENSIFNYAVEDQPDGGGGTEPTGTRWSNSAPYVGLTDTTFYRAVTGANGCCLGNVLAEQMSQGNAVYTMRTEDDNMYFEVEFESWTANAGGGGFAYTRTFLINESGCGVPFAPAATGCSDEDACNYDPAVIEGDNSLCTYPGCQDATACNYNPEAACAGPCTFPDVCGDCGGTGTVAGCTFDGACNYDPAADCDDGSCLFLDACGVCGGAGTVAGCTDPAAVNYSATADCDNGSCVIVGCTNANALNYDPAATADDGSCLTWSCDYAGAEVVDFEKVDLADWTLAENQDRIQSNLWITRQNNQGLYNHFDQPMWPGGGVGGPSNTEWKEGLTDEPGTYDSWLNAAGGAPSSNIFNGAEYGLHVLDTDLYFDITWVYFSNGSNAGGFAYQRVLNATLSGCEEVLLVEGCTDDTALNFEPGSTFDDGSCVFGDDTASCAGDLTGDGIVGTQDLLAILGLFGTECE